MKQIAYLYDWDGCLAQTLSIWLSVYKKLFKQFHITIDEKTITNQVFGDWNGPKKFGVKDIKAFNSLLINLVNEKLLTVALYPEAKETLLKLKNKGAKLGLITTSKRASIKPALQLHQLNNLFDVIIAADDIAKHKPNPEGVLKALQIMKINNPTQAIMIGDTDKDIKAGQNAHITSVLYYPEINKKFYQYNIQSYEFVISSHSEVFDIFTKQP
jgi:HAD superfamily hydrolase (TIGR01509 family)